MQYTKNLGLPIYNEPDKDLFSVDLVNDAHIKIDKSYDDEVIRNDNESKRERQEENRQATYTNFNNKEIERERNETNRKSSESSRELAESKRQSTFELNETNRVNIFNSNESSRGAAETNRNNNETTRVREEAKRVQAESLRVSGESDRERQEALRKAEETKRVNAETDRTDRFNQMMEDGFLTQEQRDNIDSIPEVKSLGTLTNLEVVTARTTVGGVLCDSLDKRIIKDISDVKESIDNINYIEGNGTLDRTLAGELRDVNVEGATYQNLIAKTLTNTTRDSEGYFISTKATYDYLTRDKENMLKPNTTYTFIIDVKENTLSVPFKLSNVGAGSYWATTTSMPIGFTGTFIATLKTRDDFTNCLYEFWFACGNPETTTGGFKMRFIILEGDYTNKPIPPYFEGIESVAEREKVGDKYQVPIKVTGNNLIDLKEMVMDTFRPGDKVNEVVGDKLKIYRFSNAYRPCVCKIKVKPNTKYRVNFNAELFGYSPDVKVNFYMYKDEGLTKLHRYSVASNSTIDSEECSELYCGIMPNTTIVQDAYVLISDLQLEEGTTSTPYEPYKEQSKTVIINETLRSLPNGVKDVVYADKGYIERRVEKGIFNGTEEWRYEKTYTNENVYGCYIVNDGRIVPKAKNKTESICDILPSHTNVTNWTSLGVGCNGATISLRIPRNKMSTDDVSGFKQWLRDNPVTSYYHSEQVIIEPIQKVLLKSYEGKTYIGTTNYIQPKVTAKALTNVSALLSGLRTENSELIQSNEVLRTTNELLIQGHQLQDTQISNTEDAVNFLLMSGMSVKNTLREREEVNPMASYLASQILKGKLNYDDVVRVYPQFKVEIDLILASNVENEGLSFIK